MGKKKLTKDDANRHFMESGYFYGLYKIHQEYEVSKELGAKLKVMLFKHLLPKVLEAKKEIERLKVSAERMEATCRAGSIPELATGLTPFSPLVNQLGNEMRAFDGWSISLLETDISLLAMIDNPVTAGMRVKGLRESFAELWRLREKGIRPLAGHPEVFSLMEFWPTP
jgi:hypothetical protein